MGARSEEYSLRVIDLRTRLVHMAALVKSGHYDYVNETACGRTCYHAHEWMARPCSESPTCLRCIGM